MKQKNKEFAVAVEKHAATAGQLADAHAQLDKSHDEVVELQKLAQGPVYQRIFDYGWNRVAFVLCPQGGTRETYLLS